MRTRGSNKTSKKISKKSSNKTSKKTSRNVKSRRNNQRTRKVLKGGSKVGSKVGSWRIPGMSSSKQKQVEQVEQDDPIMHGCDDCIVCYKHYGLDKEVAIGLKKFSAIDPSNLTNNPPGIKCKYGTSNKIKSREQMPEILIEAFDTIQANIHPVSDGSGGDGSGGGGGGGGKNTSSSSTKNGSANAGGGDQNKHEELISILVKATLKQERINKLIKFIDSRDNLINFLLKINEYNNNKNINIFTNQEKDFLDTFYNTDYSVFLRMFSDLLEINPS